MITLLCHVLGLSWCRLKDVGAPECAQWVLEQLQAPETYRGSVEAKLLSCLFGLYVESPV